MRILQDVFGWQCAAHNFTTSDHNSLLTQQKMEQMIMHLQQWHTAHGLRGTRDGSLSGGGGVGMKGAVATDRATYRKYFRSFRLAMGANDYREPETLPPGNPLNMRCYMPGDNDADRDKAYLMIDQAITAKGLVQFIYHNETASTRFADVINYLDTKRSQIDVVTIDQVMREVGAV